jgi:hypothetical protein
MSRTVIIAVVGAVIAGLTAIAFFVTSSAFDDRLQKDASTRVKRASQLLQQNAQLEGIGIFNKAERLAADPGFVAALKTDNGGERNHQANLAFDRYNAKDTGDAKADIIALVDATGNLVSMYGVSTVSPKLWKNDKGELVLPSLNLVLGRRIIISEIWDYQDKGLMKVGVAPIIDHDAPVPASDPDGVVIIGAVVVAYAQTSREAQREQSLLGAAVAYYDNNHVSATSFTRGGSEEDTAKQTTLTRLLAGKTLSAATDKLQKVTIDDTDYFAMSVAMPRSASKKLPDDFPAATAGAMVLAPVSDPSNIAGVVKIMILLLGGGALAISLLGSYLAHRRLIAQVDGVEQGVTDIINGNVDRTFRPVGPELDGLANGLNVMLARLLGRPEPGEEEFDEEGNQIVPGRVEFEETDGQASPGGADPDLAMLAQEAEPDYYKRVYTEYLAARKANGQSDEGSFENFIAKLKVNEGKLKAQYQCRAVRFRVVTKDGKVSLKPVPIFA